MDILNSLIPSAIAQEAAAVAPSTGAAGFASFIPLVLMLGVFYFLLIRPQQKKMKEHKAMVEALRRGDKVVTSSGMMGTVYKIDSDTGIVQVEVAEDVVIKFVKSAITEVVSKPEPANNNKEIKEIKEAKAKK
jgi:preprotein translocase subunit YajC